MPALRKLALARSLWVSAQAAEDTAQPDNHRYHSRIAAQRYKARILGLSSPGLYAMDPYTPVASAGDLVDHLDTLVSDAAPAEDIYAAQVRSEALLERLSRAAGLADKEGWRQAKEAVMDRLVRRGDTITALYRETVVGGSHTVTDETLAAARTAVEDAKGVQKEIAELRARAKVERDKLAGKANQLARTLNNASREELGKPEFEALFEEYNREVSAANEKNKALRQELYRQEKAVREQAERPLRLIGQRVIDQALAQSPVSPERAEQWAGSLGIDKDKSLKAKLKRIDYPLEQFKADVAEFYQLTGGKLAKVRFNVERGQRASADGIASAGKGVVNVKGAFSKRTLFHELAHHLEADPIAKQLAQAFIIKRRSSDKTQSLRKLAGHKGYDSDERAWPDAFLDPYVGKDYADGFTEVFSMGVERFSDPASLARAIAQDPEHIGLVLGYAAAADSDLFQGLKNMVSEAAAVQEQREAAKEQELETLLDRVDALIPLEQLPEPNLSPMDKKYAQLSTYLGSVGEWAIYKAKRRYINGNRRLSPCLVVMNRNHFANMEPVHSTDICTAKLAVLFFQQTSVFPPSRFYQSADKVRQIVSAAEASNA